MGKRMSLKYLLLILLIILSGCIEKEASTMEKISISAEAFKNGEAIPAEYTCDGKDISPALSWEGIPASAKSIALIMDDPDAPMGTFVHWVIFNIPASAQKLAKGIPEDKTLGDGSRQGTNDFRSIGYGGPCPPGGTHRYYFKIYALDTMLNLPAGATKADVEKAMKGHVLAQGELMGKYGR